MANLQPAPIKHQHTDVSGLFTIPWIKWFQLLLNKVNTIISTTKRVITPTYSVLSTDSVVFFDTDGNAITASLPAGTIDYFYTFKNVGSFGNNVTVIPNGTETIEDNTIYDGESFQLRWDLTEGWRVV